MSNNIEFKILEKKSDIDDIAQECSAYLKTKQFMADRIYQQQEEIQFLKQQIFSLASANSQLGKIVQNFENEIVLLRNQLLNHEKKIAAGKLDNINKTENYQLINKNHSDSSNQIIEPKIKQSKKIININKNTEEYNKFNLSDDDPLIKSQVLPDASVEKKNESFSEFEHMNYTSNDVSLTKDHEEEGACLNKNVCLKNASFPQISKVLGEKDQEICNNKIKKKRNLNKNRDHEKLRIFFSENDEIQVKSVGSNFISCPRKNTNCNLDKNLKDCNIDECKKNDFICNHNNNMNMSLYNYYFEINKEKSVDREKLQILNSEMIEKTIENNKLRTDKFILMSELNEILTSLTRIDLDKLNDFYLKNISKNNLAKYLMPTAKGIKFNIVSCQNNLAKIIKSDFLKNEEMENLNKNLKKHENFLNSETYKGKKKVKQFAPNYNLSPIKNFCKTQKVQFIEPNQNQLLNDNNKILINKEIKNNFKKKYPKNFLENNFNVNVNILYELFSKHEEEFDSLLEKKLMKFNRSKFISNNFLQSSNENHNNYEVYFDRNYGNMN